MFLLLINILGQMISDAGLAPLVVEIFKALDILLCTIGVVK